MAENRSFDNAETTPPRLKGNFFRAVSQSLHCTKLGSLLVTSGLISATQLEDALAEQKASGEQLGKILIRAKALTATQLYHKLTEQLVLKAAAGGVALVMQFAPVAAHAQERSIDSGVAAQFTFASATDTERRGSFPKLFGATETRSEDITAFGKWTEVMERLEHQLRANPDAPEVKEWKDVLSGLQGQSRRAQIEGVNTFFNRFAYIEDSDNYGKTDFWATPIELISNGGDCEDFAIAKYASLRALGFSTDELRLTIVKDKAKGGVMHAILVVYSDDGNFVLDNQNKQVAPIARVSRYEPIFSLNGTSWWKYHV